MTDGPLSEDPEFRTVYAPGQYPAATGAPVRFAPVRRGQVVVGYLWAAITDDAAGFVIREAAGGLAYNTSVVWADRLRWAHARGLRPLEALRHWAGRPEDPAAGSVDSTEQEAPNLTALTTFAASRD